jgi:hypothetical protein
MKKITIFVLLLGIVLSLGGCQKAAVPTVSEVLEVTEGPLPSETPTVLVTSPPTPTQTPVPTPDPAMEPYCIAWISDTQGYSAAYPETFLAMTNWIVDHKDELHIQYVVHTGDIVDNMRSGIQWERATAAMDVFIQKLPVFAIAGNHDIAGINHEYKQFHALMERQNYTSYPTFGGEEELGRRRYDLITIGHDDFILIGVGYTQSPADNDWLNSILSQYKDRTAILIVHHYLDVDGTMNSHSGDGWNLYRRVVMKNENIKYVLCGHRHNVKRAVQELDVDGDSTPDRTVYALMGDYQGFEKGGLGYITLLTFDPVAREIRVTAYSPTLDDYNYYEDEALETYTMPLVIQGK